MLLISLLTNNRIYKSVRMVNGRIHPSLTFEKIFNLFARTFTMFKININHLFMNIL